jgi:hypothetical protein
MGKESIYIDGLIKSQRVASGNIYKLSLVFTGELNRNNSFSEISDETSEVTVVENDNKDESDGGSTNQINQIVSTTVKSCIFCIRYGHWAKDCPLIPNKYRDCCFRCWLFGHYTKDCPYKLASKAPWMSEREHFFFETEIINKRKKRVCFFLPVYY